MIAHDANDQFVEEREGPGHDRIMTYGKGIECSDKYSCLHAYQFGCKITQKK